MTILKRLLQHRVVRNAGLMYLVQLSGYAFPLVMLPYLARVLSREKFGLISFSQMFIFYFVLLTDYGFNLTATRDVAKARENTDEVSRIFSAVMAAKAILTGLSLLLLVAVVLAVPKLRPDLNLYLLSFLGVLGNLLFPLWLYQGLQRMDQVAMRDFGAKLLALVIMFSLVRGDGEYLIAAGAQPGAMLLSGLIVFWQVRRLGVRFTPPAWSDVKRMFVEGWTPFLGLAAVSGASISNVVALGLWSTAVEVAIFSGAQRVIIALRSMVSPLSTALYPYASQKAADGEAGVIQFVRKYGPLLAAPFVAIALVLLLGGPWLLPFFLGEKYRESVPVLQIMAFIPALSSLAQVYSTYYMLACGYDKDWMRITFTLTVCNLVAMVALLATVRGAYAIAWTGLFTEALAAVLYWRFFVRRSRELGV